MRRLLLILGLVLAGCSEPDARDEVVRDEAMHDTHASHAAEPAPAPAEPAIGDLSLYQLDAPWTDHAGASRTLESLAGEPVLVAMTYTLCQVSCPVILADLRRIESSLDAEGLEARIVLLSLDPDRDRPEQLAAYHQDKELSSRWTLFRAPDDQVREMAALLGVSYRRTPDGEVAHSNLISVLDAGGVLVHQQRGLGPGLAQGTIDFLTSQTP